MPSHKGPNGGYANLELHPREPAFKWAEKIAVACRCPLEVLQFQYDPAL